jgi:predicted RNA binding protein YcfA (HicA-like mRNA interferase family)
MPKLRRLSGQDVIRIPEQFGFTVVRVHGSHHILRRIVVIDKQEQTQTVNVPMHGSSPLATGMLKRLYSDLQQYFSEKDLREHFYSD